MKLTTLRQLAVTVLVACGMTFSGPAAAQASSSAPETVTMKLHKLDNQSTQTIKNTGEEMALLDGMTPYDPSKFGDVSYSVYDLTDLFAKRGIESGKVTDDEFTAARDQLINDITNGKTEPEDVLEAQKDFVAANDLKAIRTEKLTGQNSSLVFPGLNNRGFYLIMETAAPEHHLTGVSAPMIVALPLNDKDTIHLYPKNLVARDVDPEIHKVGIDPADPTSDTHVALNEVKFTLKRADGLGEIKTLVTDKNGDIEFGGLEVGTLYVLTEASISRYPWYNQADVKDGKISLSFMVDKTGKVYPKDMQPNKDYFKIDGTRIGILNHLILGGAEFKKVDAQTDKGLAGAKFKVQKIDHTGKIYWAVFQDKTFVKWVTDKDQATALTSGDDGKFDFTGVPYVYDKRKGKVTYNLIETQAPVGYAPLKKATTFEINDKTDLKTLQHERHALPVTGGMGIWLFILIGMLLMGGAGYLYRRQRNAA